MSEGVSPLPRPTGRRYSVAAVVTLIVVFVLSTYAFHERNAVRDLTARNTDLGAALQQTRTQIASINAELASLRAPQPQATASAVTLKKLVAAKPARHVVRRRTEDPRWAKVQAQLDAQNKAIEDTRQDLASARTELSGSIAKTHDELVVLEKKGERNYFEFDIDKSKQFRRTGDVGVSLRKANVKHQFADLELLVDDVQLTKKHVNLYEPVVFYAEDNGRPIELVINSITKNHIHGYLSEPKYKASELAGTPGQTATTSQPATAADKDASGLQKRN